MNLVALAILIGAFVLQVRGRAATQPVTYYVDPTQSSLTLSGTVGGYPLLPLPTNDPTRLMSSYGSTITADRDYVANTLRITGGSITALNALTDHRLPNTYNYLFAANPVPFGIGFQLIGGVSSFTFSVSSSTISSPSSFNASQVSGTVGSGEVDYRGDPIFSYSSAMVGNLSMSPGSATLIGPPTGETLMLPIDTDLTVPLQGGPLYLHFSGTIVAGVPEPSTALLLMPPILLLLGRRRRKERHIVEEP